MNLYTPIHDPEQIPYRFMAAWNAYNPDGIADLFYEDADFVNVTGKWWNNKTDIWKAHDFGLRIIFQHSQLHVLEVKVKYPTPEVAVIHARIQLLGQTENKGGKAGERQTLFLFVAKKQADEWLVISAQNTDITGQQTNLRDADGTLQSVSYKERITKLNKPRDEAK